MELLLILLTTMMVINSSPSCSASTVGNETDQLALLELKAIIADDPYKILSSWNESRHHCQWPGVMCGHKHQRVTALNLRGLNLLGRISPCIGNLSFLGYIDLSKNRLTGNVPQEIGRLFRLRYLNLTYNTLTGSIPSNLSYCKQLNILHLAKNELMGEIPVGLGSLKTLVQLGLEYNHLRGEIPQSFGNLSSLEKLYVAHNNLQGSIPNELSELRSLTHFSIGSNNLSSVIPASLFNISSLSVIGFTNNQFTGCLPFDIGLTLPNLAFLVIGMNQFSGTIPASFANASGLQVIDISVNRFTGQVPKNLGSLSELQLFNVELNQLGGDPYQDLSFLESLSNCSRLEYLCFDSNNLGGQVPESIANLSIKLNELYMGENQIYGHIPESIQSLKNLYTLGMDYNHLSGVVPVSLGTLQSLQRVHLEGNQLSGQIPSSLGNISQLGMLILSNNRLEGKIPESIGKCQMLKYLDLSQNNLFGLIPSQVLTLPSLSTMLNLSHNSLSGSLPEQVGKLISLNALDMSSNNLSGIIPASIQDCLSLEYLNLSGNTFQGDIPFTLASIKGVKQLDLSHNKFTGAIPTDLESLSYLQFLDLSFNNLEGEIPTKGFFGNVSEISIFGNSKLCGGIAKLEKPSCSTRKLKKKLKIALIVTLACLVVFIGLTCICVLFKRRKKIQQTNSTIEEEHLMKVTYRELYRATNGFSSENLIGSGSFGHVYMGKLDHQAEKLIAIKVLNLQNSIASKSFLVECNILRQVRHRNLVKILTYCSSIDSVGNDFKALVYEFMPKGDLDIWLHPDKTHISRTLTLLQKLNIAIDIASALQYLHSYCEDPIIHCDLKPSNILLDDDMCAHVGDFGLARLHPTNKNKVYSEVSSIGIKGSIGYTAPEYGTGSEVSPSGDIYSYGIILLEMMTGRRPTDDIFTEGLNLHNYVRRAFPEHVWQIIDPVIHGIQQVAATEDVLESSNDDIKEREHIESSSHEDIKLKACIISILSIGLACSEESSTKRMDMNDVTRELHRIRGTIVDCERNRNC